MTIVLRRAAAVAAALPLLAGAALPQHPDTIALRAGAYLDSLGKCGAFSGAALVAKDGQPILVRAYGDAERSFNVANRSDTKFNLGSMGKMFTAVAVLQLVERGSLSLDGLIADYAPEYPNPDVATRVTIRQLLTHTSGLGNYWTRDFMQASKDRFREIRDYLPLFTAESLRFPPGSRYAYSNAGFMVLGYLIERVTGRSYFEYVRDNVYRPAGMANTDAYEVDYVVANRAVGYTTAGARPGEVKSNLFLHVVKGGAAGGGYSTVGDLLAFANALLANELLSPEYTALAVGGKVESGPGTRYGFGFIEQTANGSRIVGHGGGFYGISGYLGMFVDQGYTVALLSNADDGTAAPAAYIEELLVGETPQARARKLTERALDEAAHRGYTAAVRLLERSGGAGGIPETAVNARGYQLLAAGKTDAAIAVFRLNVHLYPRSANAHDSLGEAYLARGDRKQAIACYERAVALDPGQASSVAMLRKLRGK